MADLMIAPELASMFQGCDPFDVVRHLQGEIYRQMPGRRTLRFVWQDKRYFLKYHEGVGWSEIAKNLMMLKRPVLGASNEVLAMQRLAQLEIPTMTTVAWGQRGWNPACLESFVITQALEDMESLEDVCKRWRSSGTTPPDVRPMIERLADVAARMHAGGCVHQDFYICHFLWRRDADVMSAPWHLIDLHRMLQYRAVPTRLRVKDVAALFYSLCEVSLYDQRHRRCFQDFYSTKAGDVANDAFWGAVDRKLKELCRRGVRRGLLPSNAGVPL